MELDEIKKRFQTKRDDLSIYTINIYISCIKKLLELMNAESVSVFLTNPDEVIKTLEKHYENNNSRKTKLGAVLSYMNLLKKTKTLENIKSKYLTKCEEYNNAIVSGENNIHFLYYENMHSKNAMLDMIKFIILLLKKQKSGGFCIIKIDNLFYKPIVHLLYIVYFVKIG